MAEERAARESELEKVGSALSSVPTRASQTVTIGAAAVGFLTSSAVTGDLKWFSTLDPRWQTAILCLGGLQIAFVVVALVLCLTMAPPDSVGLYNGPPTTEIVSTRRPWWSRILGHQPNFDEPRPTSIGFAEEAYQRIVATAHPESITQTHIDEYLAMIAFLRASEDSRLLNRRRRRVILAAWCVAISAVIGGVILCVAAASRLSAIPSPRNQLPGQTVIMDSRGSNDPNQLVKSKTNNRPHPRPSQRRDSGDLQR